MPIFLSLPFKHAGDVLRSHVSNPALQTTILAIGCLTLQIHVSISIHELNTRLSLSDVLIVPISIGLAVMMYQGKLSLPKWRIPHIVPAIIMLTVVMSYGFYAGYRSIGHIEAWALKKYIGWYILLWYFGLGALMVATCSRQLCDKVISLFLLSLWGICTLCIVDIVLKNNGIVLFDFFDRYRLDGTLQNPNAFGFLLGHGIVIHLSFLAYKGAFKKEERLFPYYFDYIGLYVSTVAAFYTSSRTAWIAIAVVCLLLCLLHYRTLWRITLVSIILTAATVASMDTFHQKFIGAHNLKALYYYSHHDTDRLPKPEKERLNLMKDGWQLWQEHKIFGAGLGRHLYNQNYQRRDMSIPPLVIHNTMLWLLAEFGVIGALAFALCFGYCFFACCYLYQRTQEAEKPWLLSLLGIMVLFVLFSLTHEMMYQRYFWWFLGMMLALPLTHKNTFTQ